jgi:D-alanyl-D-alanine-carboxypeptidase/D-alanyl-D-alanine-endopeptidase
VRVLLALALACAPAFAQEPDAANAFDRTVEARLVEAETPGCVAVALVAEATQLKFGCSPGAGPLAFDEHSIFEIGSITKGFTGLLLADMVRKGDVSLDDPASKFARPGAKLPMRGEEPITLRDLVTQHSGLPRLPPGFRPSNPQNPYADFTEDNLYDSLAATRIPAGPAKFEYSNFGFMWLGDLIARAGGKSYETQLRERVLDPLGMKETAITFDAAMSRRFVTGHAGSYQPTPHWDLVGNLGSVGAVRSSLADMTKLARALAGREETPLKDTIALALAPMSPVAGGNRTGFGWVTTERSGTRVHWHNGGTGGFRSMIAVNPATRTAAVVLVDSDSSFDDLALHLVDPQVPLKKKRLALATDAQTMKQYVGRYELAPTFAIEVVVDNGKLMARATNQPTLEIAREGPDVFFYYAVPAKLRFSRDSTGQVDGLTLEQGGREIKGKRIPGG